ncbi:MAG: hypothetical protein ACAF41_28760 [Leptolyngbya sp. BL-A-14]
MNTPLFDRAMTFKLVAVLTLIGSVAAVLPIPRFNADIKGVALGSPIQREATVKLSALDQAW